MDGLPIEFYVWFRDDIIGLLMELFQEIKKKGEMTLSMRKGIMCLIPTKDKDPRIIRNLRPLTLLNTDYKILAKTITNRLKEVLPSIVGPYQVDFMEGCHIQENIRRTMDIIAHVNEAKKKAVIVCIDFEKCFNRIEHQSIFDTFKYFQFGPKFISWD